MLIDERNKKKGAGKKNLKHGGQFKKGQSGNPTGLPLSPEKMQLREARRLTKDELHRLMNTHIWMTQKQLRAVIEDQNKEPMLSHMIASIIQRGVVDGSVSHLNFILATIIGKTNYQDPAEVTVQNIQITAPTENQGPTYVVELNDGGKFRTARPREFPQAPLVIDAKAVNE